MDGNQVRFFTLDILLESWSKMDAKSAIWLFHWHSTSEEHGGIDIKFLWSSILVV